MIPRQNIYLGMILKLWFKTYPTSYISAASSCQSKTSIRNKTDAYEVARLLFPGLARPLQKYLRITRQQPWHTMDSILKHLALCIKHECSSKAFLQKYLKTGPVIHVSVESIAHWLYNTASLNPARFDHIYHSNLFIPCHFRMTEKNDRCKHGLLFVKLNWLVWSNVVHCFNFVKEMMYPCYVKFSNCHISILQKVSWIHD